MAPSSVSSPEEISPPPVKANAVPGPKSHPRVVIHQNETPERRPWSEVIRGNEETAKANRKKQKPDGNTPMSLFADEPDVYKVAYFIPRSAFTPANLVAAEIDQQLALNVPGLKVIVLKLLPGQVMDSLVNPQGDITGSILRSQRGKLLVKIHSNEHGFSQGDYFFVPRGNALSLNNQSERMSAILQLVITKTCD